MTTGITVLGGTLGLLLIGGVVVYNDGAVKVDVREKTGEKGHVHVIVPGIILPVAARFVPRNKLKDQREQLEQYLPTIEAAAEGLARCPDGPLVQVDNRHEHVLIQKRSGSLSVDVDSDEETVHVSIPLAAVAGAAKQLAHGSV
jgi:hypothetical protein